jgi:hypothetical protein
VVEVKPPKKPPRKCHIEGGAVTVIVIFYENGRIHRYIVCKPAFYDTCEKLIEKYNEKGMEFTKLNSESEKEYLRKIEAECHRAKTVTYS